MPPPQLAGSELNSTFRLSIQWGPGPLSAPNRDDCLTMLSIIQKKICEI